MGHASGATRYGPLFQDLSCKEEISCLNIEIRRFATYLRDEDCYLRTCKTQVREFNPQLAHQIALHRMERGRFNAHHLHRLTQISQLLGFTGNILPGESINIGPGASASNPTIQPPVIVHSDDVEEGVIDVEEDTVEDLEEDQGADDSDEEISRTIYDLLRVSDT